MEKCSTEQLAGSLPYGKSGSAGGRRKRAVVPYLACGLPNKNLREALEGVLNGHRGQLKKATAALNPHRQAIEAMSDEGLPDLRPKRQESHRTMKVLARHEERRARRIKRYEEVKRLRASGMSLSAIGRQMGIHRETVRQFIRADEYPEARPPIKPSKVSPFTEYLKKRWLEGC